MTTPAQIEQAITRTNEEIAQLLELSNELPTLHYKLQSTSAGIHLGTATADDLSAIQGRINKAILARDAVPTKQAALSMLREELADAIAHERRDNCRELATRFDRLKADYANQSNELLAMFRQMHAMHTEYQGLTGRALMHEVDYTLHLPTTMHIYDSAAHSTGSIVRSSPVRIAA